MLLLFQQVCQVLKLTVTRSMSPAKHRLQTGLSLIKNEGSWLFKVSCMILSRNRVKVHIPVSRQQLSGRIHPFFFPEKTVLVESLYSTWMTWIILLSTFNSLRICQRLWCPTWSNAFLKSTKLWNTSFWCCRCFSTRIRQLKTCSILKPACSSNSSSSALDFNQFQMIFY